MKTKKMTECFLTEEEKAIISALRKGARVSVSFYRLKDVAAAFDALKEFDREFSTHENNGVKWVGELDHKQVNATAFYEEGN